MSKTYIPIEYREKVKDRAANRCEYCKALPEELYFNFEIDHVIAEAHGGLTTLDNLALCCRKCNSFKGPNLSSYLPDSEDPIRLFNPRRDIWSQHFSLESNGWIHGKTEIGEVTASLLKFNTSNRILTRAMFSKLGLYDF